MTRQTTKAPRKTSRKPVARRAKEPVILKDPEIITKVVEDPVPEPAPKREERRRRTKLGGLRLKMSVPEHIKKPGSHYQWWHEEDLPEAKDGGYRHVLQDGSIEIGEGPDITQRQGLGAGISIVVGKRDDGAPIRDYLMEIPQELAQEDQDAVHQASQEVIDSMRRGEDSGGRPGIDQRYIPREGIKVDNSTR